MAGNNSIRGDETITFTDNMSFDGTERGGKMTTNGQLWIGSSVSRHVKLGMLTSPNGSVTIGYSSPNITLTANTLPIYTATAVSYLVLVTDQIIGVTSTAAARTITMPAGLTAVQRWTIKDESNAASINNITISGNGVNIIGTGTTAATYVINTNGGSVDIYFNGTLFAIS
jgi:hypothetical protein